MPRSWPRKPDRQSDAEFRRAEDIMNFIVHVMVFLTAVSGVWFFNLIKHMEWAWATPFSLGWLGIVGLNLVYILAIANYKEQ